MARQARWGEVRQGLVTRGKAGMAGHGKVRQGKAGRDKVWQGMAGMEPKRKEVN